MNCSNTLQQMQLFDLSRPTDITLFIEEESDNDITSTLKHTGQYKETDDKESCPSKKIKSTENNKPKIMKIPDLSIDKDKSEKSQIENKNNELITRSTITKKTVYNDNLPVNSEQSKIENNNNILMTRRTINMNTVHNEHLPVSNTAQIPRVYRNHTQNGITQKNNNNFNLRHRSNNNVNVIQMNNTNQIHTITSPCQSTDSAMNYQIIMNQGPNYGWKVIIDQVLNYFFTESLYNKFLATEIRRQLFQRCYVYVVHYCLKHDLSNDHNVFHNIVENIVSSGRRLQYINRKNTSQLLAAMFEWCRQKRFISLKPKLGAPTYRPPTYNDSVQHSLHTIPQNSTLIPHNMQPTSIQNILNSNNNQNFLNTSNKQNYINSNEINKRNPPINKEQICLFKAGTPGKEISINVDTSLYKELQNNPENTPPSIQQIASINEKQTRKVPMHPHSESTTAPEIFTRQNIKFPELQNNTNEILKQTEALRSISRDSGIISPSNCNNPEDTLTRSIQQTHTTQEFTPIITHVTSLNTNAPYISAGVCSVCKKETNKQCVGCYKVYYCSRDCQQSEWYRHKVLCSGS